jgi:dihydrofolate reductase
MSLDGFIAGPQGEYDWITADPEIDFAEMFSHFDTAVMGRKTYETVLSSNNPLAPGIKWFVFSRSLKASEHPDVTIVGENAAQTVRELKQDAGKKDIWLFGGGSLFRSLAEVKLVDTVEVAITPVLLGQGIPLLPPPSQRISLALTSHKVMKSGIIIAHYAIS